MVQHITDSDKLVLQDFCAEVLLEVENNDTLLNHMMVSDDLLSLYLVIIVWSEVLNLHVSIWTMFITAQKCMYLCLE